MLDLFKPIKGLLKEEPVSIDNVVFRLHSRFTVLLLTVCAILVTAKQYIGEPISCITDSSIAIEPVNAYCWIYSTFTVTRHLKGSVGREIVSPGVGPSEDGDEIHHHRYYQWVCFVLGLQAVLFYTPRALWGIWEQGTVDSLSKDLKSPFTHAVWTIEKKAQLLDYFATYHLHTHNFYALRYLFCESLNLLNAVGQIYFLDLFLDGQFSLYGPFVTAFVSDSDAIDPMARLFPKMAKCTIYHFGPAGSPQNQETLCVLPLNVVNEKIFVVIWFWLVLLSVITTLAVIYRVIIFTQAWARVYLLCAAARNIPRSKAEIVVKILRFGDWFLLHQLAYNVNPVILRELVIELAQLFTEKKGRLSDYA